MSHRAHPYTHAYPQFAASIPCPLPFLAFTSSSSSAAAAVMPLLRRLAQQTRAVITTPAAARGFATGGKKPINLAIMGAPGVGQS